MGHFRWAFDEAADEGGQTIALIGEELSVEVLQRFTVVKAVHISAIN